MIFIADSGSTKADWKILSSHGKIKSQSTRGFNPFFQGSDIIEKYLNEDFDDSFSKSEVTQVFYYGAGCSDAYRCEIVEIALQRVFPNAGIKVHHDLLASARALCGTQPGIACILGTGSNSCLYDGIEVIDNVTNVGSFFGDEGSGSHIGKELLRTYFYREMPQDILEAFEIFCPDGKRGILNKAYDNPTPNVYLASFSKFLSQQKTHPFVQRIVMDSFDEFIRRHILKYDGCLNLKIHFVGSVAFFFKDILEVVLAGHDLQLGRVIKQPIDSLVEFHQRMAAQ